MVNVRAFFQIGLVLWGFVFQQVSATPHFSKLVTTEEHYIRIAEWNTDETDPQKPLVLILPGLGEFIERMEVATSYLTAQGFHVVSLDWRGQGHSSRMTKEETLCHIPDFKHYLSDLNVLLGQLPKDKKIFVLANSMGGHIIMRYIQEYGQDPRFLGLMLCAPMIRINTGKYPRPIARSLSWMINAAGFNENFVFGFKPFKLGGCRFNPDHFGHASNYEKSCAQESEFPHFATGGPSFGWLEACYQSMAHITNPDKLARVTLPILMLSVSNDHKVDSEAQKDTCRKLPNCQLKEYQAHHNLLLEGDDVQNQIWQDFAAFYAEVTQ